RRSKLRRDPDGTRGVDAVERYEIDFGWNSSRQSDQETKILLAVVPAVEQNVLECDPLPRGAIVMGGGVEDFGQRELAVDRHQRCPHPFVQRVKRYCELHPPPLVGEPANLWSVARGRYRDAPFSDIHPG